MGLLDGKLAKMIILSYNSDANGLPMGLPVPYPVMYNPEKFTRNIRTNYQPRQVPGDKNEEQSFESLGADQVSFEFLFDATGASVNSINGDVAKAVGGVDVEIELFLSLTQSVDPETHQPRKLTLVWGTYILNCRLTGATITYTLFSPLGRPLRATVNATFRGDELRILQSAFDKIFSSDLTKVRIVKSGETLAKIAYDVYGDPKYYIELAKVNGITNFRSLEPGLEIILPPLEKQQS
jgi:nucleoid-associated protein YgaU